MLYIFNLSIKIMKNLQSKDLPLRTQQQYYQPTYNTKSTEGIKVYPKTTSPSILTPTPTSALPSIISYLSGLNQAQQLPRRVQNRDYYSIPKACRRHEHRSSHSIQQTPQNQQQQQKQPVRMRVDTFLSSNVTSHSRLNIQTYRTIQQRKLQQQKSQFDFYKTIRKDEKERELRFSFYNTIEKSDYFLKKFKEDSTLQERRANKYQNMVRRNIKAAEIMQLLDRSKEKLRTGF